MIDAYLPWKINGERSWVGLFMCGFEFWIRTDPNDFKVFIATHLGISQQTQGLTICLTKNQL